MPKEFPVSVQLSDKIIEYLKTRPYEEVFHLIAGLQAEYQKSNPSPSKEKVDSKKK